VCLLTGASGTLGSAFSRMLADQYDIAAVYRTRLPEVPSQHLRFIDPLSPVVELAENQHPVFAIQADLTEDRELRRVVDLVLARFGRVDLLINAAVQSVWAPIESDLLLESLRLQFDVNVMVPLKLSALVLRCFWRARERENVEMNRNIVNVSSVAGLRVFPHLGQSVYSASKAALNQLTLHMAGEFRPYGLRVNAVAPNSFPRIIRTESAVETIRRLDQGRMTGKVLVVDATAQGRTSPQSHPTHAESGSSAEL
jgi:NAD(P)-dependent dehydrogenase (short-subunit alcohol dehydrogenase family)